MFHWCCQDLRGKNLQELLSLERKDAYRFALTGGDDYELLYTVPKAKEKAMLVAMKKAHFDCYCIGIMDKNIHSIQLNGKELDTFMIDSFQGYNHFK